MTRSTLQRLNMLQRLLTVGEVAERLGVSRSTVQRKIRTGEIPALQLGGRRSPIRVDPDELKQWIETRRTS